MGDDPMRTEPDYRMDIVSEPDVIILRRSDGSEVAKFSMLGATLEEIEREPHRRTTAEIQNSPLVMLLVERTQYTTG